MSTSDQGDLLKLSREQLKQLCRERGHKGYSKCTKPQLVVLLGSGTPSKSNPSVMTTTLPPKEDTPLSAPVSRKRPEPGSFGPAQSVTKKQKRPNPIPSGDSPSIQSPTVPAPTKTKRKPRIAQKLPIIRESFASPVSTIPVTTKRPSLPPVSQFLPVSNHSLGLPQSPKLSTRSRVVPNSQPHIRAANEPGVGTSSLTADPPQRQFGGTGRTQVFKKFLDPRNGANSSHPPLRDPQNIPPATSLRNASVEPLPSPYLDFSVLPGPVLGTIGMPPSAPEKAHSWSIILSGISDAERRTCILVSRLFRYAGKSVLPSRSPGCLISTLRQSICLPLESSSQTSQASDWTT